MADGKHSQDSDIPSNDDISNKTEISLNFDDLLNGLYKKAEQYIKNKKEKDQIYNEKLKELKNITTRLNDLLKELNINSEMEFYMTENKGDIKQNIENVVGDKINAEIKSIFIEIINETNKEYQINKWISIHKNLQIKTQDKPIGIDYKRALVITSPKDSEEVPQTQDKSFKKIVIKKKEKYHVEIAVSNNALDYIQDNINEVTDFEIETMKFRNGKFQPNGKKKIPKPDSFIVDNIEDIKDYVEKYQTSGRLVFNNEDDAKIWRCLTFDVNYGKRPKGIYVVKNQTLF